MDITDRSLQPTKSAGSVRALSLHASSTLDLYVRYPQSDVLPPTPIRTWSVPEMPAETYPTWLYPHVDWEKESRWGHCFLKVFSMLARLTVTTYWLVTEIPGMKNWSVLCLFYHACPGLLGVETSAIVPYILSPIPFRTVSWVHDVMGVLLGISSIIMIDFYTHGQVVLLTLLSLTVLPLSVDLALHIATIPWYVLNIRRGN